ncbi:LPS export ABC transporter periplasmic protein LptC [Thaumasiovibrio subtropicus]|uniref:LPS export ABC transporter periplasmic protein LptC n=1 Tax=Thaumasiovibrio subtropicus TaxID=1891207 RepID=UPI000B35F829|nr:LPS export ABC transporter periplasmic protein LptC [Thaumasiovibrio subtropicus]
MTQRLSIFVLLVIIIVSGSYLFSVYNEPDEQVEPDKELPIFTGNGIASTTFSEAGMPMYRIEAQTLNYYANTNETTFDDPVVWIYQNGLTVEWRISASRATLTKTHTLQMDGNVRIFNLLPESDVELIKSDDLLLTFTDSKFTSDSEIEVTGKGFQNRGIGIVGSFKDYNATLLNDVKGRYESAIP